MKTILNNVFAGKELTETEIEKILSAIDNDTINPEQVAAILGAISARQGGVTAGEVSGFVKGLKKLSVQPFKTSDARPDKLIDVCGTGGDSSGTFNISTTVSFVVAGLGLNVVKHGNRSISSKCGCADVLEKLGVEVDIKEDKVADTLKECGMVFLYAPYYNPIMAKIKKIRNAIGIPTMFNLLGPLINPVDLDYQVMGVYDETKCELSANTLLKMGVKQAMVIHSKDGLDELSTTDDNIIYHLKDGNIKKIILSPEELGLKKVTLKELQGGDSDCNAKIILEILDGQLGPKRDIVLLNAAAALVTTGLANDFKEGIEMAKESIDKGLAKSVLERLKNVS